jgi:multicomponent Na+:H+ antiporter subunit D
MPLTTAAWVVGGLGLIGVPATAGFVTKWYLVSAALQSGAWVLLALVIASSLLAVAYVWRVVEVAYFHAAEAPADPVDEAPTVMLIATWILIGATLYLGLFASGPVGFARRAAEALLQGAP